MRRNNEVGVIARGACMGNAAVDSAGEPQVRHLRSSAARHREHIVQFYEDDEYLSSVLTDFLGRGVASGEPLLVIATEAVWRSVQGRLASEGFDVESLRASRRLVVADAQSTLERFLVEGLPDRELFNAAMGELVEGLRPRGRRTVGIRAFGEMVHLLARDGRSQAAILLEELWNDFSRRHALTLLCAYGLQAFDDQADRQAFERICQAHTDELRRALAVRDEFLSVAGHELKTPITSLALRTQALQRDALGQVDSEFAQHVAEYTQTTTRQLGRLTHLVNQLLDVSRISAGRFTVELEEVDVAEVVREVVARFNSQAARMGSALEMEVPASLVTRTDRLRVEQVITNVLDNAIKYGLGKPVRLQAFQAGAELVVRVKDQGIGIPPEHQDRIFERFERAVSGRSYGGLGLGLYITRSVLDALGGAIRVESAPGEGASFVVSLPL
jgi:signal transduction histidine kinase